MSDLDDYRRRVIRSVSCPKCESPAWVQCKAVTDCSHDHPTMDIYCGENAHTKLVDYVHDDRSAVYDAVVRLVD